jgi:hypothetical protein
LTSPSPAVANPSNARITRSASERSMRLSSR